MKKKQSFEIRDSRVKDRFFIDDNYLNGWAKKCGIFATGVYMSLCRHADKGQKCWPSIEKVAEELNISESSVKNGLKALLDKNIIQKERLGKKLTNRYYLIDKSEWCDTPISDGCHTPIIQVPHTYHEGATHLSIVRRHNSKETQKEGIVADATQDKPNVISLGEDESKKQGAIEISLTEPTTSIEVIPNLLDDKQLHIRRIGMFARFKGVQFTSRDHQQQFIKRNLRAARLLNPYADERIFEVMAWLELNADFKWTIESVSKYADEDLKKLEKKSSNIVVG